MNANLQWGPYIRYNIYTDKYGEDLCDTVKRIVHPDNNMTQFIRRRDGLEYFTITLETRNRDRAFTLHVRRNNMYITAISVGRGPIHIFSDFKNDFIENTVDMRFEGNYTCLTKTLGLKAYRLCYRKFQKAVERLISLLLSENRSTLDWKSSLFTVITVTAEGTRNTIVGYGLANSQNSNTPSGMALLWVKLLVHSWGKLSKVASRYRGGDVLLSDLTQARLDMLLAVHVTNDAYAVMCLCVVGKCEVDLQKGKEVRTCRCEQ
nr:hypothetical protein [Tanacetum cinerariifolium]